MFGNVRHIDKTFQAMKTFCAMIVLGCFVLCGYVLFKSYHQFERFQDRIYVLAGDKVLEAMASGRKDNLLVEARDHVRTFHQYFFTLDPDEKVIIDNLSKALYLADASAKQQYDNLKETGFYSGVISGNISQRISVDSLVVDTGSGPFIFRCHSTVTITRPTSIVKRTLVTRGYLREVSRSDNNPHGFLIEKWETLENKDILKEAR